MSTFDCLYSSNPCLMELGCPLLRESSDRRLRRRAAALPPLLERTFPGSIFFPAFAEVMAAVRDLAEGNRSSGVRHLSEVYRRQWLCRTSPSCWRRSRSLGCRHWGQFWRFRWFRAIIVIVGIFGVICYCHRYQDVKRIGRQVQVIKTWWSIPELPSKSVWHLGLIWVVIDRHNLWFRRCNWWYRDHFSGIVTWYLCGIENNRRIGSGYALVIGWLFHI